MFAFFSVSLILITLLAQLELCKGCMGGFPGAGGAQAPGGFPDGGGEESPSVEEVD